MIDTSIAALILMVTGILAGFSSGLLGLAGSYIDNPVMFWLLSHYGYDTTTAVRVAFGTSVAIALVIASINTYEHQKNRSIIWKIVFLIGSASIVGGVLGGTLATHVPGEPLKILFGLFLIVSAVRMVMPLPEEWGRRKIAWYYWVIAGFAFGIVSGLLGIGGGLMILPVLVCVFGVPVHEAMATCSACIVFSSAGSTLSYIVNGLAAHDLPPYSFGYVNMVFWAAIVIPTIPFTIIGARLSDRLSARKLSFIFACVIIVIACYMLGLIPIS
ncbi:MAG TPA: sulfite exporter TauE/SafE family protein [Methanoregulaceae archaeon]|nr:sulfite exporter TauE/SafE family protein [Methanoregulaceae archaeon]